MISKEVFEIMKKNHSFCGSWAIWRNEVEGRDPPKKYCDDLSVFNLERNPDLLKQLKPNIVMCALNFGGYNGFIDENNLGNYNSFHNFHYAGVARDFNLRYAFRDTEFYGAYMTDIVKFYSATYADINILNDPELLRKNKRRFEKELEDLSCDNELIIAFHKNTYDILYNFYGNKYNIINVPHYSGRDANRKEEYRENVLKLLQNWRKR